MTATQVAALAIGARVRWSQDHQSCGTVTAKGYAAVQIRWDDGIISCYPLDQAEAELEPP